MMMTGVTCVMVFCLLAIQEVVTSVFLVVAISVVETPWPSGISDLRAIYCCQTPVSGDNGRTAWPYVKVITNLWLTSGSLWGQGGPILTGSQRQHDPASYRLVSKNF